MAAITAILVPVTSAGQHATHAYWDWKDVVTEYEHRLMVVHNASTTFYASQFNSEGYVGYIGIQTDADHRQRIVFSVWNAMEGEPGSEETFCEPFGGEGVGYSCRRFSDRLWSPGVTYTLRLEIKDEWISGSVRGDDGLSLHLGRIRSPGQGDLGSYTTGFVENWRSHCRSARVRRRSSMRQKAVRCIPSTARSGRSPYARLRPRGPTMVATTSRSGVTVTLEETIASASTGSSARPNTLSCRADPGGYLCWVNSGVLFDKKDALQKN